MIVYVETQNLPQITRKIKCVKVFRYKINRQKLIAFLYASKTTKTKKNKQLQNFILKESFTIVQKIRYLRINLKNFKEIHVDYYKNLLKYVQKHVSK